MFIDEEKIVTEGIDIQEIRYEVAEYMENSGFADAYNREVKDMPVKTLFEVYNMYIGCADK